MTFASVVALLQAAMLLLSVAQNNPALPESLRNQAIQTAQTAISQATAAIAGQNTSAFSINPSGGTAPLTVTFSGFSVPADWPASYSGTSHQLKLYYGDGASAFEIPGSCRACSDTHTYQSPGTYTATLTKFDNYPHGPEQTIGSATITVTSPGVPGVSQYTDSELGFTFWYPNKWQASNTVPPVDIGAYPGGTVIGRIVVTSDFFSEIGFNVLKYSSPGMTITDPVTACPMGICRPTTRYYFDRAAHTWMMEYPNGTRSERDGSYILMPGHVQSADVSNNTMGGLHIFTAGIKSESRIVPLSAHNFLIIVPRGYGVYSASQIDAFVKTIVATDPDVATPVSTAEQIKVIQAEKDAYAN